MYLTEALVLGVVLRPPCLRGGAFKGSGVPKAARFRRRRAPLVTRLGAALVWGTRGQRIEEALGFIGRVIVFCGLETSVAASRRV